MKSLILGLTITLLGGCAGNSELLKKQMTELSNQLTDLRKAQTGTAVTVEDLETRLFLVQDELDTHRKRQAMNRRYLDNLPVVHVTPQNGPNTNAASNRVEPRSSEPTVMFDKLDDTGNVVRASKQTPASAPKAGRLARGQRDAIKLYKTSIAHLKQGEYQKAVDGFTAFIEQYPTHAYADNAVYWLGECFYDRRLWVKALSVFQQVIQNYPMGNKAPDAMLKIGLCHQQLKNLSQARDVLNQVVKMFPNSLVSKVAIKRLKAIQ